MAKIKVNAGESIDAALRRFNREVLRDGILLEIKKREFYQKPSLKRKLEKEELRRQSIYNRHNSK
ncbi:MAG: 30S ribosomal protein S21 [candidate division WWE3 bacterium]|nr:30S ribosomal protein S21 [candidate division WWE3 bacterium]